MNLLETILNAQNGEVVRQMAGKLRLDEGQARSAIGALVPALGRGIGRNAGSPQGLDALVGALSHGNHADYLDQPERLAGGEAVAEGNGILGHVFGSKDVSRQVASQAAESTGIDSGILKQMLPLLASAAMGAMAKNGLGASAQAAGQLPPGQDSSGLSDMLSSFLDADKDGSVIDDVLDMANRFLR